MKPKDLKFPYKWDERKTTLHQGVLFIPDFFTDYQCWTFPGWSAIFNSDKPVVIEYCSGNGTWIAEKAKDTTKNWVAVEWRFDRAQKIWSKKNNMGLTNLLIVCGEALTFSREYVPNASVDQVYVNFPDPWPKERHAKNRLFQAPFISELSRTIKQNGDVIVATDDAPYSEQIIQEFSKSQVWKAAFEAPYYKTEWEGYGSSFFDELWRQKERLIRYLQFLHK